VAELLPEKLRWRSIEQVCHTINCEAPGLDIALHINVPLLFVEL